MRALNRLPSVDRLRFGSKRRLPSIQLPRPRLRLSMPDLHLPRPQLRLPRPQRRKGLTGRLGRGEIGGLLGAGVLGAALAFLFDPQSGRRRRKVGRDRVAAAFRRGFRQLGRLARRTSAETYGVAQKVAHLKPEDRPVPDDATLAQKVQTEIFRDPEVPKGRINVNVENGIVVLRGELERAEQIRELVEETRKIPGVRGVENLLHLGDTPPLAG